MYTEISYSFNQIFIFNTAEVFISLLQFSCRIQKSFLFKKMITFRYNQKRKREKKEKGIALPSLYVWNISFSWQRRALKPERDLPSVKWRLLPSTAVT